MLKETLRKQGMQFLKNLAKNPSEKKRREHGIYQHLFATDEWQKADSIGVILSLPFELDTEPVFLRALQENKIVTVPKTFPKRKMEFCQVDQASLFEESAFGVREPIDVFEQPRNLIDFILVPGIIFSSEGYRIGFGGGFYDRFLKEFSGDTASLLFKEQLNDEWQPEPFDVAVDLLISDE